MNENYQQGGTPIKTAKSRLIFIDHDKLDLTL